MGTAVTVDSDDLEALLFATAAIKGVEQALKIASDDPFADSSKARLTQAHDRIANAWRGAKRAVDMPERFAELTQKNIDLMCLIWPRLPGIVPTDSEIDYRFRNKKLQDYRLTQNECRPLIGSGLAEFASHMEAYLWASSGERQVRVTSQIWIRPTPRAIEAILKYENSLMPVSPSTEPTV